MILPYTPDLLLFTPDLLIRLREYESQWKIDTIRNAVKNESFAEGLRSEERRKLLDELSERIVELTKTSLDVFA